MAASAAIIAKSAQVASVSLTGTVSFTVASNGSRADLRSDGEIFDTKEAYAAVEETLTVETADLNTSLVVGASGSTILKGLQISGGITTSTDRTCTCSNSVVQSINRGVDMGGRPVLNITIKVLGATATTSGISWT
jgi:hypothetical protein